MTVNGGTMETFEVSRSPAGVFDDLLKEAGIPLAPPPDYTTARIENLERTVEQLERKVMFQVPPNTMPIAISAITANVIAVALSVMGLIGYFEQKKIRKELEALRKDHKEPE